MARPILFYSADGEFGALSNFAPFGFAEEGVYWPTVEHYYQAQKFTGADLKDHRERIRLAPSPSLAKALGRSRSHPIRPDWDDVREDVMRHALRRKFADANLRALLLGTKDRLLVEDSPSDAYWGIGRNGKGKNRLGVLLMELRAELKQETS